MYSTQEKRSQLQAKLQEGLQTLAEASEKDYRLLGMALIQIHGAMEDFVRLEVARKAPHLQSVVEDARETRWRDLLKYSREYLGFTDYDTDIIDEANKSRLKVAHGTPYRKSRDELVRYAEFVYGKCNPGRVLPNLAYRPPKVVSPLPSPPQRPAQTSSKPPPRPKEPAVRRTGIPWYRSRGFLVLSFFFLPPIWAALVLTDRNQGALVKLLALMLGLMIIFGVITAFPLLNYVWAIVNDSPETAESLPDPANEEPESNSSETLLQNSTSSGQTAAQESSTEGSCMIVWVEHSSERLAAKNRSIIWEELVMEKVQGSGMTVRQFYDQVVERNPQLVEDGYEFKKGKTYLLPECE